MREDFTLTKKHSKILGDNLKVRIKGFMPFYIMFLPVFLLFILISYLPMFGVLLSFTEYTPYSGPNFIGLDNFKELLSNSRFISSFINTLKLSLTNLVLGMITAIIIALLLNELRQQRFKKFVQTVIYLPHFLSWIVVASIFTIILSPQGGAINIVLEKLGFESIYFLADNKWWTPVYLFIVRWKETGWATIIYLAALTGISPELYEAAKIDGAGRFQQVLYITLPSLLVTILIVFVLNLAKVMNLFESVFVLQNDMVLNNAEVISTYVFKVGIRQADYGYSTAVGLFKSLVSLVFVLAGNWGSKKVKGEPLL